jgi:hypothetical protein
MATMTGSAAIAILDGGQILISGTVITSFRPLDFIANHCAFPQQPQRQRQLVVDGNLK